MKCPKCRATLQVARSVEYRNTQIRRRVCPICQTTTTTTKEVPAPKKLIQHAHAQAQATARARAPKKPNK